MPRLGLGDIELYYEIGGTGPPLLLIPGMASDSASWFPVVEPLSRHFTLIRPDNRTTGRTVPHDAETSVERIARDCRALLDHLGLGRAHVLGHSAGGLVALTLAHDAPERVRDLVLAAAIPARLPRNVVLFDTLIDMREAGTPPDLWLRAFFPWLFHPRFFESRSRLGATLFGALNYPHAQSPAAMRRLLRAYERFDPERLATAPPVPTLALLAEDDMLVPRPLAEATLARMPGVEIAILPEAGHSLHWDAPTPFADRVTAFLQGHAIADTP